MMTSFPIFDLPYLPIAFILKEMDITDLITFSTSSNTCKSAMILLGRKYKISLNIELIENSITMQLRRPAGPTLSCQVVSITELKYNRLPVFHQKFQKITVATVFQQTSRSGSMTTFWKDHVQGVEMMVDNFLNIFPQIHISLDCASETHLPRVLNLIEKRKPVMEKVQIETAPIDSCLYKQILDVCGIASNMHLLVDLQERPEQVNLSCSLTTQCFYAAHSNWVTVENLYMMLNCTKLYLHKSNLSSKDLNEFLKKWGERSKLESLYIASNTIDSEEVMNGLETISANTTQRRGKMMTNGYTIQQSNGTKASIVILNEGFLELKVHGV